LMRSCGLLLTLNTDTSAGEFTNTVGLFVELIND